jgi:GNAT superfamily N-acetyltransferase
MREGPIWVGLEDNRVVSTLSAVHRNEELYLRGMAVLPKSRGKRIGWLLLEYAEKYALKNGSKRLLLSTTPFLTRAITLYEQFGFQRTDEGPHDLSGTPIYTMEKRLSNHEPSGDQGTIHNHC